MKSDKRKKLISAVLFIIGTILSWGGMLYATNDPECFKIAGVFVTLIGYGIFFWGAFVFETVTE